MKSMSSPYTAHEMMSMQEYKEGSKTREYRNLVDNAYDLAGQVEEKKTFAVRKSL